ncbi:hypothetical protein [Pseudomonas sp. Marseille-Q1929]|uniref:hypothetical protein n=1 Tax=Pseudomonas sp. Marseille-Q1929 TaxID=2730402 RepID=UPI001A8D0EE1|nr:hypothetical protein [Pseudomonas sp. Marseille-Q1929]MBO0493346.1 hypothetical protein [Pseudomonas sp. Marseille-Q1929]
MMLLRTLVLARSGADAPINGALLCGFAVPQISSNFLVYSLDEEAEPGSSRVYIAALRKKLERYYLGGVDVQADLQLAMQVFKQILTWAASGVKASGATDTQTPYHFIDLKGCKLPPARPEDHHSLIIKKALVMKVITLGTSAPASPAIESTAVVVPSIRFSSQMVSPPQAASRPEPPQPAMLEPTAEVPRAPLPLSEPPFETLGASIEAPSLFEVDSTLTSLARVAQELTQQKMVVLKKEAALEQWQVQLQQGQAELEQKRQELASRTQENETALQMRTQALENREGRLASASAVYQQAQQQMDERTDALEKRVAQVHAQELVVHRKGEQLAAMLLQFSGLRQRMQVMLPELDQVVGDFDGTERTASMVDLRSMST